MYKLKFKKLFTVASKRCKTCIENKTFLREIKELNKWRSKSCSCFGKIDTGKCQFFPNCLQIQYNPNQNPDSKTHMEMQRPQKDLKQL